MCSLLAICVFWGCSSEKTQTRASTPSSEAAPEAAAPAKHAEGAAAPEEAATPEAAPNSDSTADSGADSPGSASASMPTAETCGNQKCYRFASAADAMSALLEAKQPRVISFGEAHAPAGFADASTVARFTKQLLPVLAPRVSYLMVELLAPPKEGCEKEKQVAQKESDAITQGQSQSNQNEYLLLGKAARDLHVVPDILRASCEDMALIASPEGGVLAYMETIKKLFERDLKDCLGRAPQQRPVVLSYGGALHNDAAPRAGREAWAFGPGLMEATQGRYLEVDLMIPELIGDSETWKNFSWYESYRSSQHDRGALLIENSANSFALFFPPTSTSTASTSTVSTSAAAADSDKAAQ